MTTGKFCKYFNVYVCVCVCVSTITDFICFKYLCAGTSQVYLKHVDCIHVYLFIEVLWHFTHKTHFGGPELWFAV